MGLLEQWNKNKFSIYKNEEKTVLKLLQVISNWLDTTITKVDEIDLLANDNKNKKVSYDDLHNKYKLTQDGTNANYTGKWQGLDRPTLSEEGMRAIVENLNNSVIPSINNNIEELLKKSQNIINVKEFGMKDDGIFDNLTIFNNLKTLFPNATLYFPIQTNTKKYYFSGERSNLGGIKIKCDEGVILKLDVNPNLKEMLLLNDVIFENTVHKTTLKKFKNVIENEVLYSIGSAVNNMAINEKMYKMNFSTDFENKIYTSNNGEISTNGTAIMGSNTVTWSSSFTLSPQIIKPKVKEEKTLYEVNFSISSEGVGQNIGALIKTENFIYLVLNTSSSSKCRIVKFNLTGALVESKDLTLPNGGAYGLIPDEEINIGINYVNNKEIHVLFNDLRVFSLNENIVDFGFDVQMSSINNLVTIKSPIKTNNYVLKIKKPLKIAMIGDSISYGAWNTIPPEQLLKMMLKHTNNVGNVEVDNYSISGTSSIYWLEEVKKINFSSYDYVVIMLGTNDQQGNVGVTDYINNLKTIATKIKNDGSKVVFNIFPIFTNSVNSGITGVTTNNYGIHAKYTQALKIFCIDNNYLYGNVRRNIGNNIKWYGDNIHPLEDGQIEHCVAICEVINRDILFNY